MSSERIPGGRRSIKGAMASLAERMIEDPELNGRLSALADEAQALGFVRKEVIEALAVAEAEDRLTFDDQRPDEFSSEG